MALFAAHMAALGTENAFKLGEDIQRCLDRGMDVIKFNLGEPDFDSASHINAVGMAQIDAGNSHYCDPAGIRPLRDAIARHVADTRGLDVSPDRIIVTSGAKPPIGYTLLTYVNPGDEVIYPSPGFPIYESWVEFVGAVPKPLQVSEDRGFAFSAEDLEALITDKTKVIILCSPSNPTGGVLSRSDLEGIAGVIREKAPEGVRIYADEIYEHILFDGEAHHSITAEPGMEERTVLVSGHSKGFAMTGWRLGWAVLPTAEEATIFKQLNINLVSCVPPFVQEAGREAYENPQSTDAVAEMVAAFERRRDWVVPALNDLPGVRCQNPKGAFYVFPNVGGLCERLGVHDAYAAMTDAQRAKTSPSGMLQM
ncbi:MAG: aminotransferase class I/II-fold pyridoxal phosphate-dependent enzyme, partial [Acidobacteriota bacterium]